MGFQATLPRLQRKVKRVINRANFITDCVPTEAVLQRFGAAFLFLFVTAYWNTTIQIWVEQQVPLNMPPIPDGGFRLLPDIGKYIPRLADYFNGPALFLTILRFSLDKHAPRSKLWLRIMLINGVLFFMRGCTLASTYLPISTPENCHVNPDLRFGNPFLEAFPTMTWQKFTCGDTIFSGHTANMTLMALAWQHYSPHTPLLNAFAWVFVSLGFLAIVATHFHYTIDVVVGFFLTVLLWHLYHTVVTSPHAIRKYRLLMWFEGVAVTPAGLRSTLAPGKAAALEYVQVEQVSDAASFEDDEDAVANSTVQTV